MQLYRMNGDTAEQTVFDMFSGSHAMGIAAVMAGHNVITCEINTDQFSWGKRRMCTDLKMAIDSRANCQFEMPLKYMRVHKDDVDKEVGEMRFLPRPELFEPGNDLLDKVDISQYKKRVAALKVNVSFDMLK